MNATFAADIAKQLTELERVVDPPTEEELQYGTDLSCVYDVREDFAEVSGPKVVVQAICRRFLTPRGSLLDDPDYGRDIRAYLNRPTALGELRKIDAQLRGEALKDERVQDVVVLVEMDPLGRSISASVTGTLKDFKKTPFTFVLRVTDAQVLLDLQGA